jgi:16S rRNA (cytosine967-C5)-methyltransferase
MTARRTPGIISREIALELLAAVLDGRTALDEALAAHAGLAALSPRDRAFVRMLVATTLRRLGQCDRVIDRFLARPLPRKARSVRHILRLSCAQLLALGTPAHAVVDTAVALAASVRAGAFKGLVNAVLRKLAAEGPALWAAVDAPRANAPDWLWQSWSAAYGADTCRRIAEAHLCEPPLDITVRDDAAGWADRLEATVLPTGTLRRPGAGTVDRLPGFAEGAWWVQDAAAALPARVLASGRDAISSICAPPRAARRHSLPPRAPGSPPSMCRDSVSPR